MYLYLAQHGQSESEDVDPARPLTSRGREETERMATVLARLGVELVEIRHSGKTRAEQTAAVFAKTLSPTRGVIAVSGLAPNDDVRPTAASLGGLSESVMLVGHLPFLQRLAGLLLTGDSGRELIRFRYSAVVCLARNEGSWIVAWMLTPEMVEE